MQLEDYQKLPQKELISIINDLKKKKNAVILTHYYQNLEVHPVADIIGDSLFLAKQGLKAEADTIVFCGVYFMAQSAKILSPEKKVLLPDMSSRCAMAGMCDAKGLRKLREEYPERMVITYVNSSAEVKAESDIICTSANAVKIVDHFKDKKIIFAPDQNLGGYCQAKTGADMLFWNGFCYVHNEISVADIYIAKHKHPNSLVLVHPETPVDVQEAADFIGSTSEIIKFVEDNLDLLDDESGVIIGTEVEIAKLLQQKYPAKRIFNLAEHAVCTEMKHIDLAKVAYSLDKGVTEVVVDDKVRVRAKKALDKMLNFS